MKTKKIKKVTTKNKKDCSFFKLSKLLAKVNSKEEGFLYVTMINSILQKEQSLCLKEIN